MAVTTLSFPRDMAWKTIAASPDMMDTTFGNRAFPPPWRSSLAIAAYEPPEEDQEEAPCGERVGFLKITCNLTGYTPTPREVELGYTVLTAAANEQTARDVLGEYFACYGVLVNISVFGRRDGEIDSSAARIVEFEPKMRDLYQASSENGEILTGSSGEVTTAKSRVKTDSTETGLSHTGSYSSPETPYGKWEASHTIAHKWGQTTQDGSQTAVDESRDRRERWSSSTYISQLYNLLTGYHAGTNRATFIVLPRPHILQPTNRRTFAQGVRVIEGVQEFFAIVTRPKDVDELCVEVTLDTGHYPENVTTVEPPTEYEATSYDFNVKAHAKDVFAWGSGEITEISTVPGSTFTLPQGWSVDRDNPGSDPGHPAISEIANRNNTVAEESLRSPNYRAISDAAVQVSGTIQGRNFSRGGAIFDRDYRVFARREKTRPSTSDPKVTTPFLIVSRGLQACYRVDEDGCLHSDDERREDAVDAEATTFAWVVDEAPVNLATRPIQGSGIFIPPEEIARGTREAMVASLRMPSRRPRGETTFLESDTFGTEVARHLPDEVLDRRVEELPGELTVGDVLTTSLLNLSQATGVPPAELSAARRTLLEGLAGRSEDGGAA